MKRILTIFFLLFTVLYGANLYSQNKAKQGTLFIIGGGERSPQLIKTMLRTANLNDKDYVAILPMASSIPDTVANTIKNQFTSAREYGIAIFNFKKEDVRNKKWVDSLKNARLIYITGGDQNKFMQLVLNTPVETAIKKAYKNGATIAGTSAGASVMSQVMITGKQQTVNGFKAFKIIQKGNLITSQGLGLLENVIIDQHFVIRGRFNRLITALAQHPDKICLGIDEGSAIIYQDHRARVIGESQVLMLSSPKKLQFTPTNLIKLKDLKLSIFVKGDSFKLR